MKFMLITNVPRDAYEQFTSWPRKDFEAHNAFMRSVAKKLRTSGELVSTEAVTAPTEAKIVRAGPGGKPVIDTGFPESKEYLAGYWLVDVEDPTRAYKIAAELSAAPGLGGAPGNSPIEVREVMSAPPER